MLQYRKRAHHVERAFDRAVMTTTTATDCLRRPFTIRLAALMAVLVAAIPRAEVIAQHASRVGAVATASVADTLSSPPVLKNISSKPGTVEVTITAAPARLALLPGHVTDVYAYNGSIPGPTLEAHEGT